MTTSRPDFSEISPETSPRVPGEALRWRPTARWRDLLVGRRPEDVLERIMAGDPLRLRALAGLRIRATARFLDADRVVLRSMARIAHGVTLSGPPDDRAWISAEVDAALEDVVQTERTAVRAEGREPWDENDDSGPFAVLARPLELTGAQLRRACDAFNRRPLDERVAFFALFVESRTIDEAAAACATSVTEVARRARRALEALLDAADRDDTQAREMA